MKNQLTKLLTLLAAFLMLPFTGIYATIHIVHVGTLYMNPDSVLVNPGDSVRWVLDAGLHTTTSKPASAKMWNSGILGGAGFTLQFTLADGPGPFPYQCDVHPGSMDGVVYMNAPAVPPTLIPFLLDESGENFCAGTGSPAKGFALAVLSPDSTKLSCYVSHSVVSPSAAHIHLAAECSNGGIIFPFSSPTSPISQVFNVTPTDVSNLLSGLLYVNIHSGSFPDGEIRGQIIAEPMRFIFSLDEIQEVPTTQSFANGCAVIELSSDASELSVFIEHDVVSTISGHLHLAPPGVDGPIQFPFANPNTPVDEVWSIDTTSVKNLLNRQLYANIHSMAHPGGEIRGQVAQDSVVFTSMLDGAQADGGAGTGSLATGFGVYVLSADLSQLSIYIEHDIASPTNGHVHYGVPGVEGPVAFPFSSFTSPIVETWNLDPDDVDSLLNNGLYVNIHTAAFPSGEIRGQLDKKSIQLNFAMDESQENLCAGNGSVATGGGTVTLKPFGKQINVTAYHNVAMTSDAHIHSAPVCVNGGIVFPFPSFTSPMADTWYLPSSGVIDFFQQELYLNIHSMVFPSGEIRGQFIECCMGDRGDVNYDGTNSNILDLTFMVDRIFRGGAQPQCSIEADVNSDGTAANILDLTFLVDRIFRLGPPAGPCSI
jgi:plastocyanin